jgi:hypothetical protein
VRQGQALHLLGWVPPALPALALALVVAPLLLMTSALAPRQKGLAVLVTVVCAGCLIAVVTQWLRHDDGARDWLHGGVAYIDRDDSSQLGWVDWALVVTRRGLLHDRAARLRLETRLFLGLVPISSHEIKLSQIDRAHASHRDWTVGPDFMRSNWDYIVRDDDSGFFTRARIRSDHVVELTSESDGAVRLLDLSTRGKGVATGSFVETLARRINQRLAGIDWTAAARRPGASRKP